MKPDWFQVSVDEKTLLVIENTGIYHLSDKNIQKVLEQAHKSAITGLAKSIKSVKVEIARIITENRAFKRKNK